MRASIQDRYPLISVVLISYNGEQYIEQQIQSVLSQSYPRFELIVSDDGSTDGTMGILEEFRKNHENVHVYVNDGVNGIHGNLTHGLSKTQGEFIAICDQDDVWDPQKLEILSSHLEGKSAAYCDSALIDENGHSIGMTMKQFIGGADLNIDSNYKVLLIDNCVSGHAMLFRRELLARVLPFSELPMYDQQIALVAAASQGVVYADRTMVFHRQHAGNSNNQIVSKKVCRKDALRNVKKLMMLLESARLLSQSDRPVSVTVKDSGRFLSVVRHLEGASLEKTGSKTFDLKLFLLLLPVGRSLFYFSSKKRSWLKRLYRLCRY